MVETLVDCTWHLCPFPIPRFPYSLEHYLVFPPLFVLSCLLHSQWIVNEGQIVADSQIIKCKLARLHFSANIRYWYANKKYVLKLLYLSHFFIIYFVCRNEKTLWFTTVLSDMQNVWSQVFQVNSSFCINHTSYYIKAVIRDQHV